MALKLRNASRTSVAKRAAGRILLSSMTAVAVTLTPVLTSIAQAVTLNGAGATFPQPLFQRWFAQWGRESNNRVNYQGIGSGGGVNQVIAGTVDFGASDRAMTDAEIQRVPRGVLLVPAAGGGVVLAYNIPGVNSLRLPRAVYSDIFSGRITRWNDQRIAAANSGVNLPNQPIRTVVRADSSGTSFIFSNNLAAVNPYFRGRVGASQSPRWIQGTIRGQGNPGVAANVRRTPYSIGYVEYAFARQNNLPVALLQNKAGQYPTPGLDTFENGLDGVQMPANFRVFVSDPDGNGSYPIVGYTWMLVYRRYPDAAKANAVKALIRWAMNDGQRIAPQLQYVPLPTSVRPRVIQAADGISAGN